MEEKTGLEVGMTKTVEEIVNIHTTALAIKSGSVAVYGTPAVCALMERAASELAEENLAEGDTTVGAAISIKHTAPTPVGMKVRASALVTAVDGRKISFCIKAFDEKEEIAGGTHERVIVNRNRFTKKAADKLASEH